MNKCRSEEERKKENSSSSHLWAIYEQMKKLNQRNSLVSDVQILLSPCNWPLKLTYKYLSQVTSSLLASCKADFVDSLTMS